MRKLLTLAIPLLLGVGILTAALYQPPKDEPSSPRRQAGVATEGALPAVIEESPTSTATLESTTTSTAAAPVPTPTTAPAPPKTTTSTAAKPMTTVTSAAVTPKPKPAPATTTTLAPEPQPETTESAAPSTIDCGQGTASARAIYGSNREATSLYAEIQNESNREIELDKLAVQATYPDGVTKTYTLDVAGKRVQPGDKLVLSIPESTPQGAPSEFIISEFRFHTAGLPECASH